MAFAWFACLSLCMPARPLFIQAGEEGSGVWWGSGASATDHPGVDAELQEFLDSRGGAAGGSGGAASSAAAASAAWRQRLALPQPAPVAGLGSRCVSGFGCGAAWGGWVRGGGRRAGGGRGPQIEGRGGCCVAWQGGCLRLLGGWGAGGDGAASPAIGVRDPGVCSAGEGFIHHTQCHLSRPRCSLAAAGSHRPRAASQTSKQSCCKVGVANASSGGLGQGRSALSGSSRGCGWIRLKGCPALPCRQQAPVSYVAGREARCAARPCRAFPCLLEEPFMLCMLSWRQVAGGLTAPGPAAAPCPDAM